MYHVTNGAPTLIARGYSGNGDGEDNPDEQNVPQHGPIPRGSIVSAARMSLRICRTA